MGSSYSFSARENFIKKQKVAIRGFSFSQEHVPSELQRFGKLGTVITTSPMYQSRNGPKIHVTKVLLPCGKTELFLTNDLQSGVRNVPTTSRSGPSSRNTGSRIVNDRYR
jgi:hypothetical protein